MTPFSSHLCCLKQDQSLDMKLTAKASRCFPLTSGYFRYTPVYSLHWIGSRNWTIPPPQGDGVSYESLKEILANSKGHSWSAENVSFGSGGEGTRRGIGLKEVGLGTSVFEFASANLSIAKLSVIQYS